MDSGGDAAEEIRLPASSTIGSKMAIQPTARRRNR